MNDGWNNLLITLFNKQLLYCTVITAQYNSVLQYITDIYRYLQSLVTAFFFSLAVTCHISIWQWPRPKLPQSGLLIEGQTVHQ